MSIFIDNCYLLLLKYHYVLIMQNLHYVYHTIDRCNIVVICIVCTHVHWTKKAIKKKKNIVIHFYGFKSRFSSLVVAGLWATSSCSGSCYINTRLYHVNCWQYGEQDHIVKARCSLPGLLFRPISKSNNWNSFHDPISTGACSWNAFQWLDQHENA